MALLPITSTAIDYSVRVPPAPPAPQPLVAEPKSSNNSGGAETSTGRQSRNSDTPQMPLRPPGVDPSLPPQTLIDAALIAEAFKPNRFEVESPDEAVQTAVEQAEAEREGSVNTSANDSGSPTAALSASTANVGEALSSGASESSSSSSAPAESASSASSTPAPAPAQPAESVSRVA